MKNSNNTSLFQREQVRESLKQSLIKLHPGMMMRNPIMFTVEIATMIMLLVTVYSLFSDGQGDFLYNFLVFVILFLTLLFANFAEAIAEARGKAQADSLRRTRARNADGGYLPVLGASWNVSIAYTPVTNEDYAKFLKATGRKAPKDWDNGAMPAGKGRHPVVNVSYDDASAYCRWLSLQDRKAVYRLPTEEEWEFAAGHMPKDADFNCGERNGTSPVDAHAATSGACGAIDMWGNCWEWTSSPVEVSKAAAHGKTVMAVKGGSWRSPRTSCRTERKGEGRESSFAFSDVGFRVVREG